MPATEIIVRNDGAVLHRAALAPGEYLIGSAEDAQLRFAAPGISEHHARLSIGHDSAFIEDLESRDGTLIGGATIAGLVPLLPGEPVKIGSLTVELQRLSAAAELEASQPAHIPLSPPNPESKDKYEVGPLVAQGGMGAIHSARDLAIHRPVAMKVMLDGARGSTTARFLEEAQITGQLEHPNIVPVHELGFDAQGRPFYTMKLVRGITLKNVLELLAERVPETAAKYPLATLLTIFQKVCDAVAFAHSRHVIHRDLKPENIMLGDFGEVLVMDWGLAKVIGAAENGGEAPVGTIYSERQADASAVTLSGTVMGTPFYMAPEQAMGEVALLDARTDIYSLGAILYEMLTLHPPVSGTGVQDILKKVRTGDLAPMRDGAAHLPDRRIPDSLRAVCRKALALSPERRYQAVPDLQSEITAYQGGFATTAESASALRQVSLFVRRHKAVSVAVAVSVVLLAVLSAFYTTRVIGERNRAERALSDLRSTAPTMHREALRLVEQEKFDEALSKLGFALSLDDSNAGYLLAQANLLQAMERLDKAATAYRRVLSIRDDPSATMNLSLCEKLLRENEGRSELKGESRGELMDALIQQGREIEAVPLSKSINRAAETVEATIKARLQPLANLPGFNWNRIRRRSNGTFEIDFGQLPITEVPNLSGLPISSIDLNYTKLTQIPRLNGLPLESLCLNGTPISDLSGVQELPIKKLQLWGTKVSDLSPLRGMALTHLYIPGSQVSDLSPLADLPMLQTLHAQNTACSDLSALRGLKIRTLYLNGTQVRDLGDLRGLPIEELSLDSTSVTDITVLKSLPLKRLKLYGCKGIKNFEPLANCNQLEVLQLPKMDRDVSFLRSLPNLRRLTDEDFPDFDLAKISTAEMFWKKHDARFGAIAAVRAAVAKLCPGADKAKVSEWGDGKFEVDVSHLPIQDFTPLHGLNIGRLRANETPISNLSSLAGMELESLYLMGCKMLSDISPLAMCRNLNYVNFAGSAVRDLSPLKELRLTEIGLYGTNVTDLSPLRGIPLVGVHLDGNTEVTDVSPLAECTTIENITLPKAARNVEALRKLPSLKYISYRWNGSAQRPAQTAAEFWAEFDQAKGAAPR